MNYYQFPRQKVLFEEVPHSHELLRSLLEVVYTGSPPFTGYLKVAGIGSSLHFLFFFKGAPYAAGRFSDGKPIACSIQEFGRNLAASAEEGITVSLCQTDPVLLKSMLLFLLTEPEVKAPASLIDIDHIVRQIGEEGHNAMIALSQYNKINFFFFRDGRGTHAYYSDTMFKRPEGMTIDEEVQLYAYHQSGDKVQAFIFRDMVTSIAEDLNLFDQDSLYKLLTVGYLKNRRKGDREPAQVSAVAGDNIPTVRYKPKLPSVLLTVESGALQGKRFIVTLPCSIGRKNSDLILNDRQVSRQHAELKIIEKALVIMDMGSTNGTRVNGKAILRKQLVPNDLISIGPINLRVTPA